MPSVSITWHTQHDDRVCPICEAIDNYTWTFTGSVPDSLIHPEHGEVWNIHLGSLAHEHKNHRLMSNCRCHITPSFDLKDVLEAVKKLRDNIKTAQEGELELSV
jgi:hypothetical protein